MKLDLQQYWDLAKFAQFGAELDKATQAQLTRGQKMVEILKQGQYAPLPVEKQVMIVYAATNGYLDDIPTEAVGRFEAEFYKFLDENFAKLVSELRDKKDIDEAFTGELKKAIEKFKQEFKA